MSCSQRSHCLPAWQVLKVNVSTNWQSPEIQDWICSNLQVAKRPQSLQLPAVQTGRKPSLSLPVMQSVLHWDVWPCDMCSPSLKVALQSLAFLLGDHHLTTLNYNYKHAICYTTDCLSMVHRLVFGPPIEENERIEQDKHEKNYWEKYINKVICTKRGFKKKWEEWRNSRRKRMMCCFLSHTQWKTTCKSVHVNY